MNMLVRIDESVVSPRNESLEELLDSLSKYGRPHLHMHDSCTWSCNVDMNTDTDGADFKIRSEFGHRTPKTAVVECLQRVVKAVSVFR